MNDKKFLALSILFLLFTFSCKDKPAEPEIIEYQIKNKPGFKMRITDQGSEPRKLLKFNYKEGFKQSGKMIIEMDVQNTMNGNKSPMVHMPSIIMPINSTVEEVDENGNAKIKYELSKITVGDDPDSNPQLVKSLKEVYGKIKHISCTGEIDPSGAGTKPECEFVGDMEPSLVSSVKQMMEKSSNNVFVPEYPVGIGAKWEITSPSLDSGGIIISYKTIQELVNLEGDTATIDTTLSQSADEQMVKFPGTQFESKISSLSGEGSSNMKLNFNKLLPLGSASIKTLLTMIMQLPDSTENTINTDMNMNIKFTD